MASYFRGFWWKQNAVHACWRVNNSVCQCPVRLAVGCWVARSWLAGADGGGLIFCYLLFPFTDSHV